MRSFVIIKFKQGCAVFRFQHLVLPLKCCLEPFDKQGNHLSLACLRPYYPLLLSSLSPFFSSLYSHVYSFCSFGLRFFYSRILFLSLPLHIICLLEISSIFSVQFISLDSYSVFLTSSDCFPYSGQQGCCTGIDDAHSSAVFIPAQSPLKRSFLCNKRP